VVLPYSWSFSVSVGGEAMKVLGFVVRIVAITVLTAILVVLVFSL